MTASDEGPSPEMNVVEELERVANISAGLFSLPEGTRLKLVEMLALSVGMTVSRSRAEMAYVVISRLRHESDNNIGVFTDLDKAKACAKDFFKEAPAQGITDCDELVIQTWDSTGQFVTVLESKDGETWA